MKLLTLPAMTILLLTVSTPLQSQTLLVPSDQKYVGVELLIPSFDGSANVASGTVAAFATLRSSIGGDMSLLLQLPLARWTSDGTETETANGNIYVGIEGRNPEKSTQVEFGVWVPSAAEDNETALLVGVLSDVDRWESFFDETVSVRFRVGYHERRPNGNGLRIGVGPSVLIPTIEGADPEVFVMYSAHFMRQDDQLELLGGVCGRFWATISGANLGQRTFHQLDIALTLRAKQLRPGAYLLVPLGDSLIDIVDTVVGLQLGFAL